jgi:cytochrome c-type biogenesis protein CcmH/NrfG
MSSDATPVSEDDHSEISADVNLAAETTPEADSQPRVSLWEWLRNGLGGGVNRRQRQLEDLFTAIASHPDSFTNYVLRGEVYLQMGEYELAMADFEIAQKLASEHLAVDNWGLIAQVMQDRALVGLAQAKHHLEKRS